MVLTQPWIEAVSELDERVSIPLWFLRNAKLDKYIPLTEIVFPYHYGSYATK